ncbi:MAG: hypothetical protein VCB59_01520, partial [Gammaproteobacteria bacterium]
ANWRTVSKGNFAFVGKHVNQRYRISLDENMMLAELVISLQPIRLLGYRTAARRSLIPLITGG